MRTASRAGGRLRSSRRPDQPSAAPPTPGSGSALGRGLDRGGPRSRSRARSPAPAPPPPPGCGARRSAPLCAASGPWPFRRVR
ncbi:MAG: hypothetical protein DWH79_02740 [Planctomycetota bacterium]|nr:MAG: hypothetical protein DWH79_02740 [Planctomycetota bacterium]